MSLTESLSELIDACFTGIWIESHEHQDAVVEIAQLCRDRDWKLATWDLEQGLVVTGTTGTTEASDPLTAVRALNSLATADGTTLLIMKNLHKYVASTEIMQALQHQLIAGKQNRTFVLALSPVVTIPPELEKLFVVVEHALPSRDQLQEIAQSIATEDGELPEATELNTVLDAASGLTRLEAENAFSLSLVRHNRIAADAVWDVKTQTLRKSGLLTLHRGTDGFESLGGLTSLKAFCKRALGQRQRSYLNVRPRGVLLLSPPGCGKSQFCKALGNEVGRPVLMLDVGSLMGSLVGQTEERTRKALQIVDAMAPCVLMIDEIEKAFAGAGSSGQSDSGVSARMFGTFLTWLNDHDSDVFVVATSNDMTKLPAEFGRSERFDAIVFCDLPGREQKDLIWDQYIQLFGLETDCVRPTDDQWTGAEIRACCRLAALLEVSLKQSAQNIVPVAVTAAESVERLRSWASARCIDAEEGGIFRHQAGPRRRRKVAADPTIN